MRLSLLIAVFLLAGCIRFHQDTGTHPPKKPIDLFYTKAPERSYHELGMVRVSAKAEHPEVAEEKLREEARKLGADAVIVRSSQTTTIDNEFYEYALVVNEGVAIKWEKATDRP